MAVLSGLNGLPVGIALAVRAEAFSASLAARSWVIRQKSGRRRICCCSNRTAVMRHGTGPALRLKRRLCFGCRAASMRRWKWGPARTGFYYRWTMIS